MRNHRRVVTAGLGAGVALALAGGPVPVHAAVDVTGGGTASGAPLGVAVLSGFFDALSGLVTDVVDFFAPPQPIHIDVQAPPNPIFPSGGSFDFALVPPTPSLQFGLGGSFELLFTPPTFSCSLNGFAFALAPPNPCTPPPSSTK
jgi:hypothetical protein